MINVENMNIFGLAKHPVDKIYNNCVITLPKLDIRTKEDGTTELYDTDTNQCVVISEPYMRNGQPVTNRFGETMLSKYLLVKVNDGARDFIARFYPSWFHRCGEDSFGIKYNPKGSVIEDYAKFDTIDNALVHISRKGSFIVHIDTLDTGARVYNMDYFE